MQSVEMFGHNPYTKLGLTQTSDVAAVTASPMALLTSPQLFSHTISSFSSHHQRYAFHSSRMAGPNHLNQIKCYCFIKQLLIMWLSIAFKEKDFHHSIPLYLFFIVPQSLFAVSLHCFSPCESLASNTLFYPQKYFVMIFSKDPNNFLLEFVFPPILSFPSAQLKNDLYETCHTSVSR